MANILSKAYPNSITLINLIEEAWGIIANAGNGDRSIETEQWKEAASRWREKYYELLKLVREMK